MNPKEIVATMLRTDQFSRLLGIEILKIEASYCQCRLYISQEFQNGFAIAHGGIAFSLADSAAAFAANAKGMKAFTLHSSTDFCKVAEINQEITAEASEQHQQGRNLYYNVLVKQNNIIVLRQQVILVQTREAW